MGFLSNLRGAPRASRGGSRRGVNPVGRAGAGAGGGQRSLLSSALSWIGGRKRRR